MKFPETPDPMQAPENEAAVTINPPDLRGLTPSAPQIGVGIGSVSLSGQASSAKASIGGQLHTRLRSP